MGSWIHRLSAIDPIKRTAHCEHCGGVTIRRHDKVGNPVWRCNKADRRRQGAGAKARHSRNFQIKKRVREAFRKTGIKIGSPYYREDLKDKCERCGFVPEDKCQMDCHHVDGNPANNSPENKMTLCANCHRLFSKRKNPGAVGI